MTTSWLTDGVYISYFYALMMKIVAIDSLVYLLDPNVINEIKTLK